MRRVCVLNIATVTARGEPRVSAVDGHFLHGHWYFTTDGGSPRSASWRPGRRSARPTPHATVWASSATAGRSASNADTAEFAALDRALDADVRGSFDTLSDDIACLRIDADWLVGFAMTDDEMAEIEADRRARRGAPRRPTRRG